MYCLHAIAYYLFLCTFRINLLFEDFVSSNVISFIILWITCIVYMIFMILYHKLQSETNDQMLHLNITACVVKSVYQVYDLTYVVFDDCLRRSWRLLFMMFPCALLCVLNTWAHLFKPVQSSNIQPKLIFFYYNNVYHWILILGMHIPCLILSPT